LQRIKNFLNFFDDTTTSTQRSRHASTIKPISESRPTSPETPPPVELVTPRTLSRSLAERFSDCIYGSGGAVDVEKLRKLAWSGIPNELRPIAWKLLLV
jgi:hypothetical protein